MAINKMKILGIETSCDETAVAVVDHHKTIHSNIVLSQLELHQIYGGVVPEIAARAHSDVLDTLVEKALSEANSSIHDVDAIAVTAGPGLIGGVMVGVMMAKTLASVAKKPLIGVNHLEGHALTARICEEVEFPYLLLLVSGGHCQILVVRGVGDYEKLGGTIDDALGEAFDKVAKMLGLGYPGGPIVEKRAKSGNPDAYQFPFPIKHKPGCDFSFSGLKTAVRQVIQEQEQITDSIIDDICASFQKVVGEILNDRIAKAITHTKESGIAIKGVVIGGGVAANQYIRTHLQQVTSKYEVELFVPPMSLCTDNGVMIAWAGLERFQLGLTDPLTLTPRARWPLEELKIQTNG
jgi:N6-L-threonylcarbamoyladenine synthase